MNRTKRIEMALFHSHAPGMLPFPPPPEHSIEKALLVVDIDYRDSWNPKSVSENTKRQQIAASLSNRLASARQAGIPVIFVMLDPYGVPRPSFEPQIKDGGHCIGCDRGENKLAEFLEHRHGHAFEPVFVKKEGDAFTNPELAPHLRALGVKKVLLVGCNTFACIQGTAQGAVRHGFNVALIENSTYPPFSDFPLWGTPKTWIEKVQCCIPKNIEAHVAVQSFL